MKKLLLLVIAVLVPSLFIVGCGDDDILSTTEDVDIELDSFQLAFNPAAPLVAAATTEGNPSCGTVSVSLDELLSENPDWEDFADRLKGINIDEVRYMVTNNTTSVPITGQLSLTDPDTGELTVVGAVDIDAFEETDVDVWTPLPFVEGGQNIVNHYLSNRDATFDYCAEGDPNAADLSLTIGIQLGIDVTVKIL